MAGRIAGFCGLLRPVICFVLRHSYLAIPKLGFV
jgi:hypothetical protein